jgi:hypothetical protein
MKLRQDVNGVLEKARAEKRIGKALEARVSLSGDDALKAACEGVNLSEVCIVSACAWEAAPEGALVGQGVNCSALTVGVSEALGEKCPRCWMHSEAAGEDGLCPAALLLSASWIWRSDIQKSPVQTRDFLSVEQHNEQADCFDLPAFVFWWVWAAPGSWHLPDSRMLCLPDTLSVERGARSRRKNSRWNIESR